ncbi:tetracycline efflux MFS transporter Tet(G) [Platysternon megacephalum]|uniref:Tetracycline efflux MFS transporter Tet(G) n=1 Tax=Platysternon megacephalum TaxID=55544 RepID=A0A4D9DGX0_9SAUR|nr:tetracycline efflux MFS transporter Tet(G) [Platysternon megacephalum]
MRVSSPCPLLPTQDLPAPGCPRAHHAAPLAAGLEQPPRWAPGPGHGSAAKTKVSWAGRTGRGVSYLGLALALPWAGPSQSVCDTGGIGETLLGLEGGQETGWILS